MGVPDQPGAQSLSINNSIGPRLQVVYDWTRQGRSKVAANWGRFYQSFPLDMADRAFGDERQIRAFRDMLRRCTPGVGHRQEQPGRQARGLRRGRRASTGPRPTASTPTARPARAPRRSTPDIKSPYVDMFGGSRRVRALLRLLGRPRLHRPPPGPRDRGHVRRRRRQPTPSPTRARASRSTIDGGTFDPTHRRGRPTRSPAARFTMPVPEAGPQLRRLHRHR